MQPEQPACPHCNSSLPAEIEGPVSQCPACGRMVAQAGSLPEDRPSEQPKSGGRALKAAVGVLALALIGIAGFLVYRTVLNEMSFEKTDFGMAQPRTLADGAPAEQHDPKASPIRSSLIVIRAREGAEKRPVVALGKPVGPGWSYGQVQSKVCHGILARELVRQAMLIAARDELGLATRDAVVGDRVVESVRSEAVGVESLFQPGDSARVIVTRGEGKDAETLLDSDLVRPLASELDGIHGYSVPGIVAAAERLSRTEFPRALKQLGLEGRPPRFQAHASLPAGTDERLARHGFVDQFVALRGLHEATQRDGESPERLGALVRGYANMSLLCDYHLSPAYKAYRARALLYAQRLVARDPKSAWALQHRAYAEALAGLQGDALADLAEAEKLAGAQQTLDPPDWIELIDAYSRYDMRRLAAYKGRHEPLARLLGVVAYQYPRTARLAQTHAKRLLADTPDSFRALDDILDTDRAAESKMLLSEMQQALDQLVPGQIRALHDLPDAVRRQLEPEVKPREATSALREAGEPSRDAGEPSWSTLGQLLYETRFALTIRRIHWLRAHERESVATFLQQSRPLFGGHPCLRYLDAIADSQYFSKGAGNFVLALDKTDLEFTSYYILALLRIIHDNSADSMVGYALDHADPVERDIADFVVNFPYEVQDEKLSLLKATARSMGYSRLLLKVSPCSPLGRAMLIARDFKDTALPLAKWEAEAGDDPLLLDALATRATAFAQFDKARDYLVRYNRGTADGWSYRELARAYETLGDTQNWRKTLADSLAIEEFEPGDHTRAQTALAYHHAKRKEWDIALRYAESAAQSGSTQGIQCACFCYEQKNDLDRAEKWVHRLSVTDGAHGTDWFLFCKRYDRGSANEAYKFAGFAAGFGFNGVPQYERNGYLHWLGGERKTAYAEFQKAVRPNGPKSFNLSPAFPLILFAQEFGDAKLRDELFSELGNAKKPPNPELVELFRTYSAQLLKGSTAKLDVKVVDALIKGAKPENQAAIAFFAASILTLQGDREGAKAYYRRCAKMPVSDPWMQVIAIDTVRTWVRSDPYATEAERADPRE